MDTTVALADFSATLELRARQTDNCSVNNHAVLDMHYVLNNFRKVKLQNNECACMCDAVVFCYFGCSVSSGKKNDHMFNTHCLDHLLKIESTVREEKTLPDRKRVIMWNDNFPTQHECGKNFLHISKKRNESFIHKFATKFHFKGPWDGCGKRIKKHMQDCELEQHMRCGAAFACYLKCRAKFNCKNKNPIWKQHEESGDELLDGKTTFKHDDMCVGHATEKKEEHVRLLSDGHDNIACTDRKNNSEDVHPISDTGAFYQVNNFPSNPPDQHQLKSHVLSCSCTKCRKGLTCAHHSIRRSIANDAQFKTLFDSKTDEVLKGIDMSKLTMPQLKTELLRRSLSVIKIIC